jgi:ATP-binding cassette subfamily F protein 3
MRLLFAEQLEYALGARDLLGEINLELRHGQKLALVGANGAGKTTLLRLLLGQLEPTRGRVLLTRGVHLEYLEQDARFASGQTVQQVLSRGFARLDQMEGELAALEGGLADPETYHRWEALHEQFQALGGYSRQGKLKAVLTGLGFAGREEQSADSLSGGEARRLLLGSLLLSAADALFLDEPTNHLDLRMRQWLAQFLNDYGGCVLLVSHDRHFLDQVARQTLFLKDSRLRLYEGNYSAFRRLRATEREMEERVYRNWQSELERLEGVLEQAQRWAHSSETHAIRKLHVEKQVEKFRETEPPRPEPDPRSLALRFPCTPQAGRVLFAEQLERSLEGRRLFQIDSLLVQPGERIALVGPNGAGKTTLLRMLLGLLASDAPAGRVGLGPQVKVGYYDQHLSGYDPQLTLFQTLYRLLGEEAHNVLGYWRFPYEAQFKKIGLLSGGERARLALLGLSLQEANLMVLDEPTNHLDLEMIEALEEALLQYQGTLLLVSHDLFFLDRLATRTWHLDQGEWADYPAPPSEFFERRRADAAALAPKTETPPPQRQRREKGRWHKERERERLESLIAQLEDQQKSLHHELEQPGLAAADYQRIHTSEQDTLHQLEQAYQHWEALVAELE